MIRRLALMLLVVLVASCAARRPAPVSDRTPMPQPPGVEAPQPAEPPAPEKPLPTHTVKRGETMVGIALQYGLDYRELAAWNNITNPNVIAVGQVLVVAAPTGSKPYAPVTTPLAVASAPIEARPMSNSPNAKVEPRGQKVPYSDRALAQMSSPDSGAPMTTPTEPAPAPAQPAPQPPPPVTPAAPPKAPTPAAAEPEKAAGTDREEVDWMWPLKGKVLAGFTEATKGMDIAGRKGAPVLAASSGRVVYAGDGLRGYGNLVIIKHNNTWLSAYAHNDKLLVKEQDEVRKGQKIGEVGSTGTDAVKLHFEVRRQGKPVDPAKVLPAM